MTKMKRVLALLLCLLMCLSLFPAGALAEEAETAALSETELLPEEPAVEAEEPAVEAEEPSLEAEEPAAEAEEPAAEEDEPAAEAEEPAAEAEEPALEAEDPAAEAEEPALEAEGLPEETEESAADAQLTEDEAEEELEITVEQAPERYVPGGGDDNGALLDGYAQQQLDSLLGVEAAYIRNVGGDLSGVNNTVYLNLKNRIRQVASGAENTTIFEIPVSSLGLSKTSWTAAELGLSTLVADGTFSDEAMAAVNAKVGFSLREVVSALLADCPYELYWYDKTVGTSYQPYNFSGSTLMIGISGSMTFAVSTEFDNGTYVNIRNADGTTTRYYCVVDSTLAEGISAAVANASQIVEDYAGSDDYGKLLGYKNAICDLVSYNSGAASGGAAYGNPWQIIWVFDGDDTTNVVCEGYAKAFQYLCDLTQFGGGVCAYTVTGTMSGGTGAGAHMWNIVHMANGKNYLVDVTNCDAGSAGAPDVLFLAGHSSGSVSGGYRFTAGAVTVSYNYESKIRAVFGDSDLSISGGRYLDDISTPAAGTVLTLTHLEQRIADYIDSGASSATVRYQGSGSFVVDRNITIPIGMNFYLPNGTLLVDEGVTMTVAQGGTVTAKNANIQGKLTVLGTFSMDNASSVLTVSGTLDNRGSVLILDPQFRRTAGMKANGGRYYVEHMCSSEAALRSACAIAAADSDSAVTHDVYPKAQIELSSDLTVPANVRMRIASGTSLSYSSGVTLTLNGRIESRTNFTALGRTVNNGLLCIMRNASAQFVSYEGGGVLKVYADSEDPFGLDRENFSSTLDVDNYWALSLLRYTVRFVDHDGTVLQTGSVPHGTVPAYTGETPSREGTAQYSYTFTGWSPAIAAATADATYTAQYSETVNTYTVRFVDYDGTVLQTGSLPYGETPAYTGETPSRAGDAQHSYTFTGWSPAIAAVTADATYTAQYRDSAAEYTIRFVDMDGTPLQTQRLAYGAMPVYTGGTPDIEVTEQYTYTFTGWSPAITAVTGDATYTATYEITLTRYTVRFLNYDGTELETQSVEYGTVPSYTGAAPTKPATAQTRYHFTGWDPALTAVICDADYTAQYSASGLNEYLIRFVNEDGTLLQSGLFASGATPSYSGATPTKAADAQYSYSFKGWSPSIAGVSADATYTATYNRTLRKYTVKFVNYDNTVLQTGSLSYGSTPSYTGAAPSRPADAQYTYAFTGWSPEIGTVTGAATYKAQYSGTVRKYTVRFVNFDGTVLQTGTLAYGETPAYTGATPSKVGTAQYGYTFSGWDPAIGAVTGETTYTAQFTEALNKYTISFVNYDGTVLQTGSVAYGEMPVYTGATPTRLGSAQYSYRFTGWSPTIRAVTGDASYSALYSRAVNSYTVQFVNFDGTVLQTGTLAYGSTPAYTGETPTRAGTAQYSYSFTGWNPAVGTVTGDVTYSAQYSRMVNEYTVKFINHDGTVLQSGKVPYGTTPAYTGATPTRARTAKYTYTFKGWSPTIAAVTGDATYTAQFGSTVNKYTVKFVNFDGTVLQTGSLAYGATPAYTGAAPTRPADEKYSYSFTGWSPEIKAVTAAATYTAVFKSVSAGWRDIDGKRYFYGEDGKPVLYWQQIDGAWYHFSSAGVMDTGWLKSGGKWYYLAEDGAMQTGFITDRGTGYYLDENGAMVTGWQLIGGKWYYFKDSGAMAVDWLLVNGKWYYFDENGVMVTGWAQVRGKRYYMNSSGAMVTGWLKLDGKWYYFKDSGAMAVDWLLVSGTWYYFDENGVMVTGWALVRGKWYYMSSSGAMQTGWLKSGGVWYYLKDSGAMAVGWQKVSGTWYYFKDSGAMHTGWLELDGKWYYLESSGAMVTGSRTIGGKTYNFNSSGVCLNP